MPRIGATASARTARRRARIYRRREPVLTVPFGKRSSRRSTRKSVRALSTNSKTEGSPRPPCATSNGRRSQISHWHNTLPTNAFVAGQERTRRFCGVTQRRRPSNTARSGRRLTAIRFQTTAATDSRNKHATATFAVHSCVFGLTALHASAGTDSSAIGVAPAARDVGRRRQTSCVFGSPTVTNTATQSEEAVR